MITVGEIKSVSTDINNTVICDVDISLFRSTVNKYNAENKLYGSIYTATICTPPGLYMPYEVGDVVYIGFVNNTISNPVILGKVHKNLPKEGESSSYAYFKTLNVTDRVRLSENTTIGDIKYDDISNNILKINNLITKSESPYMNNKYSTEESIIGVWTDNKKIYRQSGEKTISSGSGSTSIKTISGVDKVISINYTVESSSVNYGQTSDVKVTFDYSNNSITYQSSGHNNETLRYVIEYTKTTD